MQNSIQIFENSAFGKLEVLMLNGKPYFPATECAVALGYKNPRKAIIDHCRSVTKRDTPHKKQNRVWQCDAIGFYIADDFDENILQ
jgi:prophage antirepressor-like protein